MANDDVVAAAPTEPERIEVEVTCQSLRYAEYPKQDPDNPDPTLYFEGDRILMLAKYAKKHDAEGIVRIVTPEPVPEVPTTPPAPVIPPSTAPGLEETPPAPTPTGKSGKR